MTAFSDADLDRLADFVGGALDGTPEADDVRRLVSTEQTWAEAYAMLVSADAAMRDELHALGAEAPGVPLDVQQRLDAALAAAMTAPPADAPVVDLARARAVRNRRRMRWAVGLSAAAAAIVCAGFGVQALRSEVMDQGANSPAPGVAAAPNDRGTDAARADGGSSGAGSGAASGVISSGRDYGRGTLGDLAAADAAGGAKSENVQGEVAGSRAPMAAQAPAPANVPSPLARLAQPAARAACLGAITTEYGGQVSLVDYAAFEGRPALVVVVDGTRLGAGKRLIVVVGPDCGTGGAIADERYRTIAP